MRRFLAHRLWNLGNWVAPKVEGPPASSERTYWEGKLFFYGTGAEAGAAWERAHDAACNCPDGVLSAACVLEGGTFGPAPDEDSAPAERSDA